MQPRGQSVPADSAEMDALGQRSRDGIQSLASIIDISAKREDITKEMEGLERSPSKKVSKATRSEDRRFRLLQQALWSRGVYHILEREDLRLSQM